MKKSILLVDDEIVLRLSLEFNLQREGFEISCAASGEEALAELAKRQYDLLLTDYFMEDMNGVELMHKARKIQPAIKVMVFSGYSEDGFAAELQDQGADDFFCKPIEYQELLARLTKTMAA